METYQLANQLKNLLTSMRLDLLDVNDNKTAVINKLINADKYLSDLRDSFSEELKKQKLENTMFCDELKIEFSVNNDFSDSYTRNYEAVCLSMEALKTIIYGERMLQNESDDYLFARVIITDTDPEFN